MKEEQMKHKGKGKRGQDLLEEHNDGEEESQKKNIKRKPMNKKKK